MGRGVLESRSYVTQADSNRVDVVEVAAGQARVRGEKRSPVECAGARADSAGWNEVTRANCGCSGMSREARAGVGR